MDIIHDPELDEFFNELPMADPNDWTESYVEVSTNGAGQLIYRRVYFTPWKVAPLP